MSQHHTIVPDDARWLTPREEHTDEQPFCEHETCLCHFDPEHMERHFVAPIERGELTIGEALERYGRRVSRETVLR